MPYSYNSLYKVVSTPLIYHIFGLAVKVVRPKKSLGFGIAGKCGCPNISSIYCALAIS